MNSKRFLVSMGIALTALVSHSTQAKSSSTDSIQPESHRDFLTKMPGRAVKDITDPIVESLTYQTKSEQHLLLLRKAT